jgi:hypothetical protein
MNRAVVDVGGAGDCRVLVTLGAAAGVGSTVTEMSGGGLTPERPPAGVT